MIECQRAYEMNSKAISTTDQMLQYLTTNLCNDAHAPAARRRAAHLAPAAAALVRSLLVARGLRHAAQSQAEARAPPVARSCRRPRRAPTERSIQAGQQMELFADLKARRVGDVLTIVLNEVDHGSKTAVTKTTKTTAVANTGPTHLRHARSRPRACRSSTPR